MAKKKIKKSAPSTWVVVAHPDDETIFFGGTILRAPTPYWKAICVTDANADGKGVKRRRQFEEACGRLGIHSTYFLNLPDKYEERLNLQTITASIQTLTQEYGMPKTVYTHGILGEYGHPHHQDVSFAVHAVFHATSTRVYSTAYNCFPQRVVKLRPKDFETKCRILSEVYFDETKRFSQFIPASFIEGHFRTDFSEIKAIYDFLTGARTLDRKKLSAYRWYEKYILEARAHPTPRPF